jgi:hypothetical protein
MASSRLIEKMSSLGWDEKKAKRTHSEIKKKKEILRKKKRVVLVVLCRIDQVELFNTRAIKF